MTEQAKKSLEKIKSRSVDFQFTMLGRLLSDCKYYLGAPEHSRVKSLETIDGYFTRLETADRNGWEVISEKDRAGLVDAYKKVLADFEKRLQTYLKRYGLTKLNTWTYLSD